MSWNGWRALLAALALPLFASCSDGPAPTSPASPESTGAGDAELAALTGRVQRLGFRIELAGGLTPEIEQERDLLSRDVQAWQARTGRGDVSVTLAESTKPCRSAGNAAGPRVALAIDPLTHPTCGCAAAYVDPGTGKLCVLTRYSCAPGHSTICVHVCFSVVTSQPGVVLPPLSPTTGGVLVR